jgi:hypothetical protein
MFMFCVTTVAAAQMRRTAKTRKSTIRNTSIAVRKVSLALALLAVLAAAGTAQAGGHGGGGSMGGGSMGSSFSSVASHNSSGIFSQSNATSNSNAMKFNQPSSVKLDSNKATTLNNTTNNTTSGKNTNTNTTNSNTSSNTLKTLTNNKASELTKLADKNSNNDNKGKLLSDDKSMCKNKCKPCCPCKCYPCCPWWYCWNYPCWCPLYGCDDGCWDDVPVVAVDQGLDLQLLAVRIVDSGDPEKQLGPAFRVWFRNNSQVAVNHPFNVLILAARDAQPTADLPQTGVRVDSIDAGQTLAVDIRLPVAANQPGFPMLHVLVDSHREIAEVNKTNNGLVINRADIQPIDEAPATGDVKTPDAPPPAPVTSDAPVSGGSAPVAVSESSGSGSSQSTLPVMMQGVQAE